MDILIQLAIKTKIIGYEGEGWISIQPQLALMVIVSHAKPIVPFWPDLKKKSLDYILHGTDLKNNSSS